MLERPLTVSVRQAPLLTSTPWTRTLGKVGLEVSTQGWRFPTPGELLKPPKPKGLAPEAAPPPAELLPFIPVAEAKVPLAPDQLNRTRVRPPGDMVVFKDRLLYLLQPPLEDLFGGKQVQLPFPPYHYQVKGIAFLMPRHAALIADEMGLGKTLQTIVALRLLLHSGLIHRALIVCPKPLVINWTRELRLWAEDVPFEIVGGDTTARKATWFVSKCPVKLVNYELLTRDAAWVNDEQLQWDVVVLDEAHAASRTGTRKRLK